jgi:hypothetical protein
MMLRDPQGHSVWLPVERWEHIIENHPGMMEFPRTIGETLQRPDAVRRSNSDPDTVELYYKRFPGTLTGNNRWVCVVVKRLEDDALLLTAYVTDAIKEGEEV